ncbi:MAG TPA: serine hydrolase domain-containing protein [Thermoanaerobaculia bacterium]|nr:serine hydrolase domain-containing protein [Thermoanaerobaculia bacterium]
MNPDRLQAYLDETISAGLFSAVTALIATPDEILWEGSAGQARPGLPATPSTRYDFGSITKPFAATLALLLDRAGELPLATRVGQIFPETAPALRRRSLSSLLRHRSGVAAWASLYTRCFSLPDVFSLLLGGTLPPASPGTYSDLSYLIWSLAAERRLGIPFGTLLRDRVLLPLGLSRVEPNPGDQPDIAESFMGTGKEVELAAAQGFAIPDLGPAPPGLANDGNARFLRTLGLEPAGHAGLFGTARDLLALGAEWLRPGLLLQPADVDRALAGGGPFALGWWRRRNRQGGGGAALPAGSFGHTGFPGGNLWVDPTPGNRGRILVLLGHRIDPFGPVNSWRRRFHTLAYDGPSAREASRPA